MILENVIVIDGGFSSQLSLHFSRPIDDDPLWTARANIIDPNAVIQTHLDFLTAGCNAILTNTYQASVEGFMKYLEFDREKSLNVIKSTVRLAQTAREQFLREVRKEGTNIETPWIVGSIGPYGAYLHDGSEYSGSYADEIPADTIRSWHRPRIDAILETGVDALAIETIPCKMESELLQDLLANEYPNVKYWISFQCKDTETLAHGENFADTIIHLWNKSKNLPNHKNLIALGTNCTHPKNVSILLKSVNESRLQKDLIPLVVYPNSGEVYQRGTGWTGKDTCIPLENYVPEWINLGVRVIGGCCRTYADDIQRIKQTVEYLKHCKKDAS